VRRLLLVVLAASTGCATFSPGLHLSEPKVRSRSTSEHPIDIVPITPELLVEQAQARAVVAAARPAAPGGNGGPYEYRVAPFDVLSVIVWDHPELTIPAGEFRAADLVGNAVQADGTMFYPHVGVVAVAGRTIPEIRALLTDRLRKYVENPQLDVRVAAFRGNRAQVTGEVVQPTPVPITDVPLRVQDAIAAARGFTPDADWSNVTLSREGRVYKLNLQALYENGDLSQNWFIKSGDVIHVGDRMRNKVFVLGEVRQPQSKLMVKGRLTLAEAINETGGLEPSVANPRSIFVIRGEYEAPSIYRLDAGSPDALLLATQFQLRPRDVVFVSTYKLAQWNRVMTQILPTVDALWRTYDLGSRVTESVRTGVIQ
jgi:polysaccharide export outer membrane protein